MASKGRRGGSTGGSLGGRVVRTRPKRRNPGAGLGIPRASAVRVTDKDGNERIEPAYRPDQAARIIRQHQS